LEPVLSTSDFISESNTPASENMQLAPIAALPVIKEAVPVSFSNKLYAAHTPKTSPVILKSKQSGFYVGIAAGPELNQIKNQGVQKLGYDIGIIAGYRFSKRFSVETGLSLCNKSYFSDGKYFKMDNATASMPAGMKVMRVEGNTTFW
jgi:hypothetical protein